MLMPSLVGMNDFFDDVFADDWMNFSFPAPDRDRKRPGFGPHPMKTDIKENESGYVMEVELPGFSKADITASLENGYLTIAANKNYEEPEKKAGKERYIRRERFTQSIKRSFYVGNALKQEDITARFENGILILNIPKKDTKAIEENKYIAIEG